MTFHHHIPISFCAFLIEIFLTEIYKTFKMLIFIPACGSMLSRHWAVHKTIELCDITHSMISSLYITAIIRPGTFHIWIYMTCPTNWFSLIVKFHTDSQILLYTLFTIYECCRVISRYKMLIMMHNARSVHFAFVLHSEAHLNFPVPQTGKRLYCFLFLFFCLIGFI
jgi:hypothetical protein